MSAIKVKHRNAGVDVEIGRLGVPVAASFTGGHVTIATGVSAVGFNPLDLMYASLGTCLALSLRVAASELSILDRFTSAHVRVTGEKIEGEFKRIGLMNVTIEIEGDLDADEKECLAHRAEEICTISNTLKQAPAIVLDLK